ncbi:uncharacterized protein LOC123262112 [Cotesia glomerata]|nr:uncharacterized protein LOC123262112 [Cotesia glomerata]
MKQIFFLFNYKLFVSLISMGIIATIIVSGVKSEKKIPKYLEECYTNETLSGARLPMTLNVLIDIFRKIELHVQNSVDLRLLVTSMLHRFKFDGIEQHQVKISLIEGILPFSGTGSQRVKNEIINEFIPGNPDFFPVQSLSLVERCTLHRAISNTIADHDQPESKLCVDRPTEKIYAKPVESKKLCPLEQGIILTEFGTVAPGTLITGIAAALQYQTIAVKLLYDSIPNPYDFNEDEVDFVIPRHEILVNKSMWFSNLQRSNAQVDNIWLATVAGELAELVIYEGPIKGEKMSLGSSGSWDSTMRPMLFYLLNKDDNYEVTRAEIVGAVDGFIIANSLRTWIKYFNNLRLSQIFEIYYSSKGAFFDSNIAACERGKVFWYHASRKMLKEQTYAVSQILAYKKSISYMTDESLKTMVNHAVSKFTTYVNDHLFTELRCHKEKKYPRVQVLVAFDGSWSKEYTQDFLSVLIEDLNVSLYGSKIGILNGENGDWILNTTDSPSTAHEKISTLDASTWPNNLNIFSVINTANNYLTTIWSQKSANHDIGNLGQVILLLAPRTVVKEGERQDIKSSLINLKSNHPDVNIVYFVSKKNAASFREFLTSPEDYLIDSRIDEIASYVSTIPRSLRLNCSEKNSSSHEQVEDYVKPQESIFYRLDPQWRWNTQRISMTIISVGYGSFEVCWWTQFDGNVIKNRYNCRELSGHSEFIINDTQDCKNKNANCPGIYYQIRGLNSLKKCAEIECRTPEYIRYLLRLNIQCSRASILESKNLFVFLLLILGMDYLIS